MKTFLMISITLSCSLFMAACIPSLQAPASPDTAIPVDPAPDNSTPLEAGTWRLQRTHDGVDRYLYLYIPTDLPNGDIPLLTSFHGFNSTADNQMNSDGFKALADQEKFVVAWVQGSQGDRSWNIGKSGCLGQANENNIDDIGLVKQFVTQIKERVATPSYNIDDKRVYAYGHSNGGGLVHSLGKQANDVFAAIAPASFPVAVDGISPFNPVSVIHFHGDNDKANKYDGGAVDFGQCEYSSAPASQENWKTYNGCIGEPIIDNSIASTRCETYTSCNEGKQTRLCTIIGGGHDEEAWGIDVAGIAWGFMSSFQCESCE